MVIDQRIEDRFAIYNGDCCEVLPKLQKDSIDLSIYSPPFVGMWQYSSGSRDLSNCRSYEEFFNHYEFVVKEIARVTKPGRITAVHCMDVPKRGANVCGYTDFPGDIVRMHEKCGFEMLPRICIWKEPLGVRNRTMSKALAHKQIVEDSTLTNVAAGDYLIPFRKKGKNGVPVSHPTGLQSYAGEQVIPHELNQYKGWTGNQIENRYSHWIWRQYASCFWDDIRIDNVVEFAGAEDPDDDRHPHPLQLDVIERCVTLWSNDGEVVLTPFMGVGSEIVQAVLMNRKGIGIELKPSYYKQALKNVHGAATGAYKRQEEMKLESSAA